MSSTVANSSLTSTPPHDRRRHRGKSLRAFRSVHYGWGAAGVVVAGNGVLRRRLGDGAWLKEIRLRYYALTENDRAGTDCRYTSRELEVMGAIWRHVGHCAPAPARKEPSMAN